MARNVKRDRGADRTLQQENNLQLLSSYLSLSARSQIQQHVASNDDEDDDRTRNGGNVGVGSIGCSMVDCNMASGVSRV